MLSDILSEKISIQQNGKVIHVSQREAVMRAAIAAAIRSKKVSDHVGFLTFMRNTGILHWDQQYQEELRDLDAQRTSAWTDERSEGHTSELQSLMRISYAILCLQNQTYTKQ